MNRPPDTTESSTPALRNMLPHIYTSLCKTRLHLTAYREATASPGQVAPQDVPDTDCYDFAADRDETDGMLETSRQILEQLEQHRSTYYPDSAAFGETATGTSLALAGRSPRLHHTNEAAAWILVAEEVSLAYAEGLPEDSPAWAHAWRLADDIYALLATFHRHACENTLSHGVHYEAYLASRAHLDAMNPLYTDISAARK